MQYIVVNILLGIVSNILANVKGLTLYYKIFKTASAVRCSQNSLIFSNQTDLNDDLNCQYLNICCGFLTSWSLLLKLTQYLHWKLRICGKNAAVLNQIYYKTTNGLPTLHLTFCFLKYVILELHARIITHVLSQEPLNEKNIKFVLVENSHEISNFFDTRLLWVVTKKKYCQVSVKLGSHLGL